MIVGTITYIRSNADVPGRGPQPLPQPGGPGNPGGAGGLFHTFEFHQPQPATTWTVVHNRNGRPSVTIFDSAGDQVETTFFYADANTVLITFTAPTSGTAYLN